MDVTPPDWTCGHGNERWTDTGFYRSYRCRRDGAALRYRVFFYGEHAS